MSQSKELAKKIKLECKKLGWSYQVKDSVLTINKPIMTMSDYNKADSEYPSILSIVPTTSKVKEWGTDSSGVGSVHAMYANMFTMNKSGCSKLVLNALAKL